MVLTLPIREVLPVARRARAVRLALGTQPFEYEPGQAVLIAASGQHRRRPYSIAISPMDARRNGYLELLITVDDDRQPDVPLPLQVGAELEVEGPLGTFTFPQHPEEQRFLFIAGGTGIAPVRAMLQHALAREYTEIGVLYSARSPDEFAYQDELTLLARRGRIELRQTVTRSVSTDWTGGRGRLGRVELEPVLHDPATLCFVCGPATLVDELPKHLTDLGVPRARIRIEQWS